MSALKILSKFCEIMLDNIAILKRNIAFQVWSERLVFKTFFENLDLIYLFSLPPPLSLKFSCYSAQAGKLAYARSNAGLLVLAPQISSDQNIKNSYIILLVMYIWALLLTARMFHLPLIMCHWSHCSIRKSCMFSNLI